MSEWNKYLVFFYHQFQFNRCGKRNDKEKINIQTDIQIMCFDENDAFYILPYTVPFIRQPIKEIAQKAVELLFDQIEMQSEGTRNIVIEAELVTGENAIIS